MTIPALLFDGTDDTGDLIAHITLSTSRRAAFTPVTHKLDEGWIARVAGSGALEMRVTADGITSMDWLATLYARQDARTPASYHVALAAGDSHTGSFMVEELDEAADADQRRRFRLVLLSSGKVTYTPAL